MEIYNRPVKNLFDNFAFAAEKFGAKPLFCFARAKVDYEISYREFSEYAAAMTRGFIHLGLAGKRVAIIGENCPEWIATYLAAITSGGIAVPIDVALSKEQLVSAIQNAMTK
jgi:long-chain acyl-CoA synthetase